MATLKELRVQANWSRIMLSQKVGVSNQTIWRLEEKPNYATSRVVYLALCQAFNVSSIDGLVVADRGVPNKKP